MARPISRSLAQVARRWFPPGLWEGPADRPWVVLTFDDAPEPEVTCGVLDALAEAGAPATFFTIGARAARHPSLVRRMRSEGHEVGNHTWSHRPLMHGVCASPLAELERTEELLAELAPGSLKLFRPPFGAIGPGGSTALGAAGLLPVYWSVLPADWDPTPPDEVRRRVHEALHPGAVVVLHAGRPWHRGTTQAVAGLVQDIRDRGYEIVALERMLDASGLTVTRRGRRVASDAG